MAGPEVAQPDFRVLFESAPGMFLVLTDSLEVVAASDAYLYVTGTHRQDVVGREVFDLFDRTADTTNEKFIALRDSLEKVRRERVVDTVRVLSYPAPIAQTARPEFADRFWRQVNVPVLAANGDLLYITHRIEDITELVQLAELEAGTAVSDAAHADATLQAISSMDARFARQADEILESGRQLKAANVESGRLQAEGAESDRLLTAANVESGRLLTAAGVETDRLTAAGVESDRLLTAAGVETDRLTAEGVESDRLLTAAGVETDRLTVEGELSKSDLLRALANLDQFVYIVSHDLQSPVRNVSGVAEMLRQSLGPDQLTDEVSNLLSLLDKSTARMLAQIQGLLQMSRLQSATPMWARVDLTTIAEEAIASLEETDGHLNASITIDGTLPILEAEPLQMTLLIQNLVGNAVKYRRMDVPAVVAIATVADAPPGTVEIVITDNGIGIAAENQERIFRIFQRLHAPRDSVYQGTGIGLALADKIVQNHRGTIWVQSEGKDQGCAFHVRLPKSQNIQLD